MVEKSRIVATIVAIVTLFCIAIPSAHASESSLSEDPLRSPSLEWEYLELHDEETGETFLRIKLYPVFEDENAAAHDGMSHMPSSQAYDVFVKYMTHLYQTPLAMARARQEQRLAIEKKKETEKKRVKTLARKKSIAKAHYAIATAEEKPGVVITSSEEEVRTMYVSATAYSSTVDQTDASPCTTANGFNVCKNNQENVVAANFLPFGTRIRIPEIYGDRVFTVHDRMARRYSNRVDIWMKTREAALKFGVRKIKIEILDG